MRENTASQRQHASRPAVEDKPNATYTEESLEVKNTSLRNHSQVSGLEKPPQAATNHASTVGGRTEENHLLTVREVAQLLHLPVSWVYGRMRKRSSERLPAYRLGKYWRFREDEVLAWVECHRGGPHAA